MRAFAVVIAVWVMGYCRFGISHLETTVMLKEYDRNFVKV